MISVEPGTYLAPEGTTHTLIRYMPDESLLKLEVTYQYDAEVQIGIWDVHLQVLDEVSGVFWVISRESAIAFLTKVDQEFPGGGVLELFEGGEYAA